MKVIIKRPGEGFVRERIPNELKALQDAVGGYIETYPLLDDCAIVCNEEGRLLDLPFNIRLMGVDFVGTILFVGVKGEDFVSVPKILEDLLIKEEKWN